jgi:hypothetical protein
LGFGGGAGGVVDELMLRIDAAVEPLLLSSLSRAGFDERVKECLIFDAGPSKLLKDRGVVWRIRRSEFEVSLLLPCYADSGRLKTVMAKLANIHVGN